MRAELSCDLHTSIAVCAVTMRQRKDHRTKSYTIWLANEPPQVHIKRKEK